MVIEPQNISLTIVKNGQTPNFWDLINAVTFQRIANVEGTRFAFQYVIKAIEDYGEFITPGYYCSIKCFSYGVEINNPILHLSTPVLISYESAYHLVKEVKRKLEL